jgi:hypothetical protein
MPGPDALESSVKSPEEQVCYEGSESVYDEIFSDPQCYSEALQSTDTSAVQCLQEFDTLYGAPEIDYSSDICESPQVTSTDEMNGRTVREHMGTGPDVVVAYDDAGQAQRFVDEPVTKLPVDFSAIPEWRGKQLDQGARDLVERYYGADEKMSFQDVANIMKDISGRKDLTETEKCRLWTGVHHEMRKNDVSIDDSDENPAMVDSWKGSWDPWHAIVGLNDGYHADKLINMSPADASKEIFEHEDAKEGDDAGLTWQTARFVLGINQGDINASEGQLKALRQLREQGSFSAYAKEWEKQFVSSGN